MLNTTLSTDDLETTHPKLRMIANPRNGLVKATTLFEYIPLNPNRRRIRLVTLLPGNWQDDIHCEMTTVKFGKRMPKYEALSYVWGGTKATRDIRVNDERFLIGKNLWIALRRLRMPHSLRFLWIDAICINQQDDNEKSRQVAMMKNIFQSCDEVICWLGEEENMTTPITSSLPPTSTAGQKAFDLIRMYASYGSLDHLTWSGPESLSQLASSDEYKAHFEALRRLLSVQWWQRIWIVQELILPPRATFVYGSETCDFETFACAVTRFDYNHRIYSKYLKQDTCNSSFLRIISTIMHVVLPLVRLRSLHLKSLSNRSDPTYELATLRGLLCSLHASNPRDLFYALLGLTNLAEKTHLYSPDYTLTFQLAVTRMAVDSIKHSNNFAILTGTRYASIALCEPVPTWLPPSKISTLDSSLAVNARRYFRAINSFKASQGFYSQVDLINDWNLRVRTICLGKIKLIGPTFQSLTNDDMNLSVLRRSLQLLGLDHTSHWPQDAPPLGSLKDSFWRTFMSSRMTIRYDYQLPQSPVTQDYCNVRSLFNSTIEKCVLSSMEHHQLVCCMIMLHYRSLVMLEDGRIGSAPSEVMPGDEVHVLIGAHVPFILRPRNATKHQSTEQNSVFPSYTVLGDGYLHGVMEGEAMEGRSEESWEPIELC
jgi:hypothetical protein